MTPDSTTESCPGIHRCCIELLALSVFTETCRTDKVLLLVTSEMRPEGKIFKHSRLSFQGMQLWGEVTWEMTHEVRFRHIPRRNFLCIFTPFHAITARLKKHLRVLVTINHTVFNIQKVHFCETLLGEPEKAKKIRGKTLFHLFQKMLAHLFNCAIILHFCRQAVNNIPQKFIYSSYFSISFKILTVTYHPPVHK